MIDFPKVVPKSVRKIGSIKAHKMGNMIRSIPSRIGSEKNGRKVAAQNKKKIKELY